MVEINPKNEKALDADRLRRMVNYDSDTGIMTWRERKRARIIGAEVGTTLARGYVSVVINYRKYMLHRLVWLYVYGQWPTGWLDHRNGNPSDNRIDNLREATPSQNQYNRRRNRNNKSGCPGVYWQPNRKKWMVQIKGPNGKSVYVGRFNKKDDAYTARRDAEQKYYGEFARA